MENTIKDRFTFTYESGVTGSFLVATSKEDNIVQFQIDMLAKNPNKHILHLDIRRNNDKINLYYNITSKLSLSQYLKRNQIDKSEFIEIFIGIVKTLLASKGFLLSDNSFLLDAEYIYISPDNMDVSLVYLPVKLDIDITKQLKEFGINLIVYGADVVADDKDSFLQQFLSFLKKDTFSIIAFDKFLKEIKRTVSAAQAQSMDNAVEMDQVPPSIQNTSVSQKGIPKQNNPAEVPIVTQNRHQGENKTPQKGIPQKAIPQNSVPQSGLSQKSASKNEQQSPAAQNNVTAKLTGNPNMLIGAIIQAVIVIAILVLAFSGVLDAISGDKVTTIFALALIGGAASYFMWKNVLKIPIKNGTSSAKNDSKPVPPKTVHSKPKNNLPPANVAKKPSIPTKSAVPPVAESSCHEEKPPRHMEKPQNVAPLPRQTQEPARNEEKPPRHVSEIPRNLEETLKPASINEVIKPAYNVNETVLLGVNSLKFPQLQVFKDGSIEEVTINKPSFIIGRLGDQVDYVHSNNAIGKVHAEIITRDGHYYLKDLNSRNGTYINDKRLDSNIEYEIKNNDKLTLADSKFIFVVFDN